MRSKAVGWGGVAGGSSFRCGAAAIAVVVGLYTLAGCQQTHGHEGVGAQAGQGHLGPNASLVDAAAPAGGANAPSLGSPPMSRPEATTCGQDTGAFETPPPPEMGNSVRGCNSDADCTAAEGGHCTDYPANPLRRCYYDECRVDGHCPDGMLCACGRPRPAGSTLNGDIPSRCVAGNCRVDADCEASEYCSPTPGSCGPVYGVQGFFCHTPQDECLSDDDCGGDAYCAYNTPAKRWLCSSKRCAGKPG